MLICLNDEVKCLQVSKHVNNLIIPGCKIISGNDLKSHISRNINVYEAYGKDLFRRYAILTNFRDVVKNVNFHDL